MERLLKERSPELFHLLSGYFHEDWKTEHKTVDAAVHAFMRDEDDRLHGVVRELEDLLAMNLPETELAALVKDAARFYPPALGYKYTDWLQHVLSILKAGIVR